MQPRIMLETLTSNCALAVFVLLYIVFALSILVTLFGGQTYDKETITLLPDEVCQGQPTLPHSGSHSCFTYPDTGPYETVFSADMMITGNLIGEVSESQISSLGLGDYGVWEPCYLYYVLSFQCLDLWLTKVYLSTCKLWPQVSLIATFPHIDSNCFGGALPAEVQYDALVRGTV